MNIESLHFQNAIQDHMIASRFKEARSINIGLKLRGQRATNVYS